MYMAYSRVIYHSHRLILQSFKTTIAHCTPYGYCLQGCCVRAVTSRLTNRLKVPLIAQCISCSFYGCFSNNLLFQKFLINFTFCRNLYLIFEVMIHRTNRYHVMSYCCLQSQKFRYTARVTEDKSIIQLVLCCTIIKTSLNKFTPT